MTACSYDAQVRRISGTCFVIKNVLKYFAKTGVVTWFPLECKTEIEN